MRLIDADALRESIEKDMAESDMPKMWYEGIEYAIDYIIHAPTVSSDMAQVLAYECGKAERKRGEWKEITDRTMDCCYRCSECGFIRDAYFLDIDNYCPNCGAEMERVSAINRKSDSL